MPPKLLSALCLIPLLAACGGAAGSGRVNSTAAAPPPPMASGETGVRPPMRYRPRNPQMQALPGLEGVLGASTAELTRTFGPPRLDVWEGDARKLQFSGAPCVLDVFLYPDGGNAEPIATYVDARRATDGQEVDHAARMATLRQGGR